MEYNIIPILAHIHMLSWIMARIPDHPYNGLDNELPIVVYKYIAHNGTDSKAILQLTGRL